MKQDKFNHLIGGFILALTFGSLGTVLTLPVDKSIMLGVSVGLVAAAAKEVFYGYRLGKGTPEVLDFVATAAGVAAGSVVFAGLV